MNEETPKPEPGFVKKKIAKQKTEKKPGRKPRARKAKWPANVAKVVKKAIQIAHLFTEEDQMENLRVIRRAKKATHNIWSNKIKDFIEVPDTKNQLAAVVLELAYREGKPGETHNVTVKHEFEDLGKMIDAMASSEEVRRAVGALPGATELPIIVQETGGENEPAGAS